MTLTSLHRCHLWFHTFPFLLLDSVCYKCHTLIIGWWKESCFLVWEDLTWDFMPIILWVYCWCCNTLHHIITDWYKYCSMQDAGMTNKCAIQEFSYIQYKALDLQCTCKFRSSSHTTLNILIEGLLFYTAYYSETSLSGHLINKATPL